MELSSQGALEGFSLGHPLHLKSPLIDSLPPSLAGQPWGSAQAEADVPSSGTLSDLWEVPATGE